MTSYAYELAQNTLSVIAGSGASSTIDLYRTSSVLAARIQADPNSNLFIYNNNNSVTAKLSLLTSGNFGIGTTTPSSPLSVQGATMLNGAITQTSASAQAGQAMCYATGGTFGHCTSIVGAGGACTCVAN